MLCNFVRFCEWLKWAQGGCVEWRGGTRSSSNDTSFGMDWFKMTHAFCVNCVLTDMATLTFSTLILMTLHIIRSPKKNLFFLFEPFNLSQNIIYFKIRVNKSLLKNSYQILFVLKLINNLSIWKYHWDNKYFRL